MYKYRKSWKNTNGSYRIRTESVHRKLKKVRPHIMMIVNKIALALIIVGALNWGLVGLFSFDLVAWICGGATAIVARIIYTVIALAGIWCISMLFMDNEEVASTHA